LVKKNQIRDISLVNVSLEDDIVYKYFAKGDTIGIFQFGSNGMRRLLKRMRPKSINDISLCLALYRPGPLKNIDTFIDNRYHPIQIKYLDSKFIPILNDTSGIIVYQEQLIEIIKIVCNYSYAQADIFRAIISKKQIDKLNDLKTQFIVDARKNNYSQEQAEKIFSYIESFAEYGFNRSHAISYAMLSY
jgi:DNA polymerase-3 subunit alpha